MCKYTYSHQHAFHFYFVGFFCFVKAANNSLTNYYTQKLEVNTIVPPLSVTQVAMKLSASLFESTSILSLSTVTQQEKTGHYIPNKHNIGLCLDSLNQHILQWFLKF